GNFIGTNVAGTSALGNDVGVFIAAGANASLVGSDLDGMNDAAERNVISGNTSAGVRVSTPPLLREFHWTTGTGANNHYYVTTPAMNYFAAESLAVANGGHLVSITSHDEQVFITNNVAPVVSFDAWIGATDDPTYGTTEGNFVWT